MRKIIGIIKNDEVIKFEELNLILAYVSKNIDLTLARQISENISHTISEDVVYQLNNKSIEQIKVIYLIDNILTECYKLLSRPRGKNKIKIAYSLMALHNLPRALFEDATRFLIDIPPLTTHEAICTAQSYLSICSNGL